MLLLDAAPSDPSVPLRAILPHGPTPADYASTRRAVSKLYGLRLIAIGDRPLRAVGVARVHALVEVMANSGAASRDDIRLAYALRGRGGKEWKSHASIRFMRRTPLGEQVVQHYRRELESALSPGPLRRLRWR